MSYLMNVFIAIDQLGNALAGGNPDITISARVGYFANYKPSTKEALNWKLFERIIDTTFWPVDGKGHCLQSYHADAGEMYQPQGYKILHMIAALFILTTCPLIAIVTYSIYLFGYRPKPYDSLENIESRTEATRREICGMEEELNGVPIAKEKTIEVVRKMINEAQKLEQELIRKLPQ